MLNMLLVLFKVLNLFLALLLSTLCGDHLVPEEKGKNNVQIAINHIKKAVGRIRTCRDPKCRSDCCYWFSLFLYL